MLGGIVEAGVDLVVGKGNFLGFRGIRIPAALVEFPVVQLGEAVVARLAVSEGPVVELSGLVVEADLLVGESSGLVFGVGLDSVG